MPIAEERIIVARKALTMLLDWHDTEAVIHILKEDAKMSRVWRMASAIRALIKKDNPNG